jgi:hypothetical protein
MHLHLFQDKNYERLLCLMCCKFNGSLLCNRWHLGTEKCFQQYTLMRQLQILWYSSFYTLCTDPGQKAIKTLLNFNWLYVTSNLHFFQIFSFFFKSWQQEITRFLAYTVLFWKNGRNTGTGTHASQSLAKMAISCKSTKVSEPHVSQPNELQIQRHFPAGHYAWVAAAVSFPMNLTLSITNVAILLIYFLSWYG